VRTREPHRELPRAAARAEGGQDRGDDRVGLGLGPGELECRVEFSRAVADREDPAGALPRIGALCAVSSVAAGGIGEFGRGYGRIGDEELGAELLRSAKLALVWAFGRDGRGGRVRSDELREGLVGLAGADGGREVDGVLQGIAEERADFGASGVKAPDALDERIGRSERPFYALGGASMLAGDVRGS
jgi:hypothetical protein